MAIDISSLRLPAVSEQGLKVLELIGQDNIEIQQLVDTVAQDPALSAAIIKYANSPVYRRRMEITNVRSAVNLLGLEFVRTAVMISSMRSFCEPFNPAKETIWEHAFSVATLAHLIAKHVCIKLREDIELTGLLHDLGALVLCTNYPDEYAAILRDMVERNLTLDAVEREVFGVTHDEITKVTAEKLRLPGVNIAALDHFHSHETQTNIISDVDYHIAVVSLAHLAEAEYQKESALKETITQSKETLLTILGLSEDTYDDILDDFAEIIEKNAA